jgi:hypothetical protein
MIRTKAKFSWNFFVGSRPWRVNTGKLGHITAICAGDLFNLGANVLVVISAGQFLFLINLYRIKS